MKRFVDWLPLVLGIGLLSTLVTLQWHRVIRGQNDFAALYAGGTLAGTPDLYSRTANEAVIQSVLGMTMDTVVYTRPPFYAALLKPLTFLPYLAAYGIFCALCIASILWFIIRFSKDCESLPLYAAFSIPIAAFLPQGQDAPLLLTITGASILLIRQKRDFLAGVVLSFCAIKFHLFLLVPILLLTKKRWNILAGGATATAALTLLGVLVAGFGSLSEYIRVLRDPWINFSVDMMPNLHGLIAGLNLGPASTWIELTASCGVVGAFLWICQKTDDYEFLFGLSLLCGLLISYHSGISDQIVLLLAFVLIVRARAEKPLRIALALLLTPVPYFTGLGINITIPIMLLAVLVLSAVAVTRPRGMLVPAVA